MSKLLLYCTKAKPYLEFKQIPRTLMEIDNSFEGYRCSWKRTEDDPDFQINGKIVAECDYEVEVCDTSYHCIDFRTSTRLDGISRLDKSCLTSEQLLNYVKGKNLFYAIYIKNLHIFDEPKELSDYYKIEDVGGMLFTKTLTNAPKNMMRVSVNHWEYATYNLDDIRIIIPVSSQEMCRIANKEQTILVRKVVLKEMLNNE